MTNHPRRVYVPEAIGAEPTTVEDALRSAHAMLDEEGRWAQHVFYNNAASDTDEYADNPWCNGWGTCAVGALQCVTLGVYRHEMPDYTKPYDHATNSYCMKPAWQADEDKYDRFVDDYATEEEWADLTPRERMYVEAHQTLDRVAIQHGHETVIALNDSDGVTRDVVLDVFLKAAEMAAEKVTAG